MPDRMRRPLEKIHWTDWAKFTVSVLGHMAGRIGPFSQEEMSKRLGISAHAVRCVLRKLRRLGVVESRKGYGTVATADLSRVNLRDVVCLFRRRGVVDRHDDRLRCRVSAALLLAEGKFLDALAGVSVSELCLSGASVLDVLSCTGGSSQ